MKCIIVAIIACFLCGCMTTTEQIPIPPVWTLGMSKEEISAGKKVEKIVDDMIIAAQRENKSSSSTTVSLSAIYEKVVGSNLYVRREYVEKIANYTISRYNRRDLQSSYLVNQRDAFSQRKYFGHLGQDPNGDMKVEHVAAGMNGGPVSLQGAAVFDVNPQKSEGDRINIQGSSAHASGTGNSNSSGMSTVSLVP